MARLYNALDFAQTLAARTRTPILIVQTDGAAANSMRYQDITGLPDGVREQLYDQDLAYVTFDSVDEANTAFDTLVANFPESSETTLSITAILGIPGERNREFQQIHGHERTFDIDGETEVEP